MVTIDQTFKNDGGVSGYLDSPYNDNDEGTPAKNTFQWDRIVFDNMFNLILVILIIQIASGKYLTVLGDVRVGIIFDTFTALRQRTEEIESDKRNMCFICGKSRDDIERIEKSEKAFTEHIKASD